MIYIFEGLVYIYQWVTLVQSAQKKRLLALLTLKNYYDYYSLCESIHYKGCEMCAYVIND